MDKLKLKKCMCCSIKSGGLIWGMFHMCLSITIIVIASLYMLYTEEDYEMRVFSSPIIACGLYFIFDLFLLIGLTKNHLNMILVWLIWNGTIAVCLLWHIGLIMIVVLLTDPMLALGTLLPLVYLSIETYFVVVVLTYYLNEKYPPGSMLYDPPARRGRQFSQDIPSDRI